MKTKEELIEELSNIAKKYGTSITGTRLVNPNRLKLAGICLCAFCDTLHASEDLNKHLETEHPKEFAMKAFW